MSEAAEPDGGSSDDCSGIDRSTDNHTNNATPPSAWGINQKKVQIRDNMYASFDRKVEAVLGKFGTTLVAREFIPAGAVIWSDRSHLNPNVKLLPKTKTEILSWDEETQEKFLVYAWQDSEEIFTGNQTLESVFADALNYFNHSCDPNCWYKDDSHIIARRDIQYGDEMSFDYCMCESVFVAIRECECGTPLCRGQVLPDDWKNPTLQQAYGWGANGHWRNYLNVKIAKYLKDKEAAGASSPTKSSTTTSSSSSPSESVDCKQSKRPESKGESKADSKEDSKETKADAKDSGDFGGCSSTGVCCGFASSASSATSVSSASRQLEKVSVDDGARVPTSPDVGIILTANRVVM